MIIQSKVIKGIIELIVTLGNLLQPYIYTLIFLYIDALVIEMQDAKNI